ncbi:SLAP domain-containing protein [Ureibacillus xyleni]|uniref:SLAP domain-containing protein n=1 Tax=Ureibacillus xyleni TaxID=614648 RepID=A0A285T3I5_9BACL|nr:SLAP domain-containing protein [Ureibacillus xyleni]SOC15615.1 SLAP domain-containing protein [Ureibacillus xyleni]
MQQLQFEASWDKALSPQDRQKIEQVFNETKHGSEIHCTSLQVAMNHKEALLVTVIVHNFTNHLLTFHQTKVSYHIDEKCIADHAFTLPALAIPPKVSMPWTFIFPKGSYKPNFSYEKGQLVIH